MDQHTLETDLLVAGGGMAGICAAIRAARQGITVVLVQDRSVLGGNASSEVRMHIVGADSHGSRRGWRESGLIEELRLEDAVRNSSRRHALWDVILYEKVLAEPNITLLLDTDLIAVEMQTPDSKPLQRPKRTERMYEHAGRPGRIAAVRAVRQITQDEFLIRAKVFADCTGDGRLAWEAGADFRIGRESKETYGESLAPEVDDNHTMGSSILFTSRKMDKPVPYTPPPWARKFTPKDLKVGRPIHSWEYGFWWIEWGGMLDTIKDHTTTIRHELYKIALGLWDYVKNSGNYPESVNWALDFIGAIPGKRESRRFLGPYVLTQQDVQGAKVFEDEVAYGGWPIDLHPPEAMDDLAKPPYYSYPLKQVYGIPLRCYFSRNIENLFLAGRDISVSHVAFGSTRVMATCSVGGEAVGFAAAFSVKNALLPAQLASDPKHIFDLKQAMLREDVTLLNTRPDPSLNKAHAAKISASSFATEFAPDLVCDGYTRDEIDSRSGNMIRPHSWRSGPLADGPAWLEFEWREPAEIREIHLWFDTGFQRELTLSASDSTSAKMVRGPQWETVKQYSIELDGQTIASESANYQRKRVHALDRPLRVRKLRLNIHAAHNVPEARVFEVRVF